METQQEITALDKFLERHNKKLKRDAVVCDWHIKLHLATGVDLPYNATDGHVYCNQSGYDSNGDYYVDEDATVKFIAKVIQYAKSRLYGVEKKYDDDNFRAVITISEDPRIVVSYIADRKTVCTPKVVGQKVIPAQVIEARVEDEVEWECDKISFLGMDTD